uniref:hypothetical protein n=1 Tax=Coprococcus sp. TaxID=2049024 RepID=UPI0040295E7D
MVVFVVEVAVFIAAVLLVARAALVPVYVLTAETVHSFKVAAGTAACAGNAVTITIPSRLHPMIVRFQKELE